MRQLREILINRSPIIHYGLATIFVIAAVLLRSGLGLIIDRPISVPIFLAAIVLSTLISGLRVGLYSAFISGVAFDYYFVQPFSEFSKTRDDIIRIALFFVEGGFLSWLVEKLRIATDELSSSREALRELTKHQQTLREEEQKRIAFEIHDELGQGLTGLKLDVHLVKRRIENGEDFTQRDDVVAAIEDLNKHIDATIGTVRKIASGLRPQILDDFGLVAAMEWQAREFERKSGVECDFRSNADTVALDEDTSNAVFRIFQEALTNVTRHAQATCVKIAIGTLNKSFFMRVEDDGLGIDHTKIINSKSMGIFSMRERARRIGGELVIEQNADGGTVVELMLPINHFRTAIQTVN